MQYALPVVKHASPQEPSADFSHIFPAMAHILGWISHGQGGFFMSDSNTRPLPPPPPAPQDLDEFIFHWEGELPTTSQR